MDNIPYTCIHILLIHSSAIAHLGCSHVLSIVNYAAMSRGVYKYLFECLISLILGISRSRIAGLYGHSVLYLEEPYQKILKLNLHVFHRKLHFPPAMHKGSNSSTSSLMLGIFCFLIVDILMKWYLIVALICNSLTIRDAIHPFMYLLATCISSLEKCLLNSFAHFRLLLNRVSLKQTNKKLS